MQNRHILALHGFLGYGKDWYNVQKLMPRYQWITPDLFTPTSPIGDIDLTSFNALADRLVSFIPENTQPIFVGYSLGGRIGLHLLERYPDRFKKFIFISAHPGLASETEKQERKANDIVWKDKLHTLPWADFWNEWNNQDVFKLDNDRSPMRNARDVDLKKLELGLTTLSLAAQENKEAILAKHTDKVIWAVGDKDQKFTSFAEDLKRKKILPGYERIFNSGHRVLFDQPSAVADLIAKAT
jgi:2-succinyl-6-hydroxy-2,4-cyclohexadiene-1-carboxylate synthase